MDRRLRHERARIVGVAKKAGHAREDDERIGVDGHGDRGGDPIAVHVERLLLRGQRERRDDRDAPRPDELREQREIHRLDLTGVVVAKEDGLPALHRAHVLLARDEETTGYS